MSNTSSESGLSTRHVKSENEQQNLPSQEQSELKLTRTELTLIKKVLSQFKEIVSQSARIGLTTFFEQGHQTDHSDTP